MGAVHGDSGVVQSSPWAAVLVVFCIGLVFLRFALLLRRIWRHRENASLRRNYTGSLLVVLGSGGHTAEALEMLKHISASSVRLERVVYVVAKTDSYSASKAANDHEELLPNVPHKFYFVPRAREVGQSYWTAVISTVYAVLYSLSIVPRENPGVLLVNGPGTCVPLAISAFLFNFLLVTKCRIIFVESIARVKVRSCPRPASGEGDNVSRFCADVSSGKPTVSVFIREGPLSFCGQIFSAVADSLLQVSTL